MERPSHIPQSTLQPPPAPAFQSPGGFDLENKISPSILLIIIILAIIFFVSGLLHLLVRLLLRPNNRHPDEAESDVTALQGQLQQLFHLHDAGVDQSYIDTLPVFHYKSIIGVKDPFDCAVCLCEFEPEDSLRLLPGCSHAFHLDCIDTWLLSHSTCPLCRSSLLSDFFSSAPVVCIVESDSETATEAHGVDRELGELGSSRIEIPRKSCEISMKESESGEKIVSVRLGKFRNVDGAGESSSTSSNNNNGNSRRCFSMGSFAYVMDETTSLQVPIRTPAAITKKQSSGFPPLKPGHRSAVSEYGSDSRREYNVSNRGDTRGKGESFSVSKVLFRSGEMKNGDSSNRAFSFRFRLGGSGRVDGGGTSVENWWENGGSEMGWNDEETRSVESHQSMRTTSGRTLLWLMARHQNKVIYPSFSSNV